MSTITASWTSQRTARAIRSPGAYTAAPWPGQPSRPAVVRAKNDMNRTLAQSCPRPFAQAIHSHRPMAIGPKTSTATRWTRTACNCAGSLWAVADLTLPAVTTMVIQAASSTAAPAHMSRTAVNTVRRGTVQRGGVVARDGGGAQRRVVDGQVVDASGEEVGAAAWAPIAPLMVAVAVAGRSVRCPICTPLR